MNKFIATLAFAVVFLSGHSLYACTTFFLHKNEQKVFGKNYDWVTGTGAVHTNLRGIRKTSLPLDGGRSFNWTSKYGSLTFNQYGKEFPNGGMNEKGLVIELMWLDASEYPKPDQRNAISVLQWIQYQLDNSATIDEVIASDAKLRVVSNGTPQHYLVADAKGNVATIEFLKGKMVAHKGSQLPYTVLANDPYQASLKEFKNNKSGRFTTACKMVQEYETVHTKKAIVDHAFDILDNVAQGSYTRWNIVYDITNKKIYFKTDRSTSRKKVGLEKFSFKPDALPMLFNVNTLAKGNVNSMFIPFSANENSRLLRLAFSESAAQFQVPEHLLNAVERMGQD